MKVHAKFQPPKSDSYYLGKVVVAANSKSEFTWEPSVLFRLLRLMLSSTDVGMLDILQIDSIRIGDTHQLIGAVQAAFFSGSSMDFSTGMPKDCFHLIVSNPSSNPATLAIAVDVRVQ